MFQFVIIPKNFYVKSNWFWKITCLIVGKGLTFALRERFKGYTMMDLE